MNSSGETRTLDLTIMSRALLPAELRCPENDGVVPVVVPKRDEIWRTSSVSDSTPRHYESGTAVSDCHSAGKLASGKQREATGGNVYSSASRSAGNPRPFASYLNGPTCDWPPKPEKGHHVITDAVNRGWVKRGKCFAAGPDCKGKIQGHHHDYAQPLAVTWCCMRHHRALDNERRAGVPLESALVNAVLVASAWAADARAVAERRAARKAKAAQIMALFGVANVLPEVQPSVSRSRKRRVSRPRSVLIKAGNWPKIGKLRRVG